MTLPRITSEGARTLEPVAPPVPPVQKVLKATIPASDQHFWCWAAAAVGVARAYGKPEVPQCDVATRITRIVRNSLTITCCPHGSNVECNKPQLPSLALTDQQVFDRLSAVRTFDFVVSEIDNRRLIPVRLKSGSSGHVVVIAGYVKGGSEDQVIVWNPATGEPAPVAFTQFRDRFESKWSWDLTYLTTGGQAELEES